MNCGNKVTIGVVTFSYKLDFDRLLLKLELSRGEKKIAKVQSVDPGAVTFPGSNREPAVLK